jgi:hypothetical protein
MGGMLSTFCGEDGASSESRKDCLGSRRAMEIFGIAIVDSSSACGRCDQQPLAVQNAVKPDQAVIGDFFNPSEEVDTVGLLEETLQYWSLLYGGQMPVRTQMWRQEEAICHKAWQHNDDYAREKPSVRL